MTKKQLKEIREKAFALELRAYYTQQADDVIVGFLTHQPKMMELFMIILFANDKKKVAEFSIGYDTAKILIEKLNEFIKTEKLN